MPLARYQRNQIIIGAVVAAAVLIVILMVAGVIPGLRRTGGPGPAQITLDVWNVFEGRQIYAELIDKYELQNPNVTIRYQERAFETYRNDLTQAFAEDRAPDIYAIHNTWLPLQEARISPAPPGRLPFQEFEEMFPDVVRHDFVREDEAGNQVIYALPLHIDTLALYYNKTYFDSENILSPPANWSEFIEVVKRFTRVNEEGNITLSGAALGTARNVNRSTDILSLLMLQSGVQMTNPQRTAATFAEPVTIDGIRVFAAEDALRLYTSFANPESENYTWNDEMPFSIDAFIQGKTAMMINYSHHTPTIERKAPYLDFRTGQVPQPEERVDRVNYANYWGFAVSKKSPNTLAAWDFILFLLEEENAKIYLEASGKPTSLRRLVAFQQNDPRMRPFANQVLTARSWYQGDSTETELVFADMIDEVLAGEQTPRNALELAASKVNLIFRQVRED